MAEEPSLHIDTDWKKQAQEEKRRLAEQDKEKASAPPSSAAPPDPRVAPPVGATSARARPGAERGQLPPPSFAALVQSIVTQILFYVGDLATRGQEPMINLDMAKHQIDILGILEEKSKGNLTEDEQRLLDAALYETRMRYVAVSQQFIT
jgi:hypothetical protein